MLYITQLTNYNRKRGILHMSSKKLPTIEELSQQMESDFSSGSDKISTALNCHHSLVHNAFEWVDEDK